MVQTRFKQVLFGANWDIQLHFSFLLTVRPQKIKNQKTRNQKIDFVRNYRKWKWKKKLEISICTKKYLFEPLVWIMFYYFILIVQKLNFPPSWIFQCPFNLIDILKLHPSHHTYGIKSRFIYGDGGYSILEKLD